MHMKEKKEKRALLFIFITAGATLIACFVTFFILLHQYSGNDSEKFGGLMKPPYADQLPVISERQRQEEYESRDEIPEETTMTAAHNIQKLLSCGQFSELDHYLQTIENTYRRNEGDEGVDWITFVNDYRADIAAFQSLTPENGEYLLQNFKNPDVLAAAIAYSTVETKYKALISWDSVIFPPVEPIDAATMNLREAKADPSELAKVLKTINQGKAAENQYLTCCAYDMKLYGVQCRLYLVTNSFFMYAPARLDIIDNSEYPAYSIHDIREIVNMVPPETSLDDMITYSKVE